MINGKRTLKKLKPHNTIDSFYIIATQSWLACGCLIAACFFPPLVFISAISFVTTLVILEKLITFSPKRKFLLLALNSGFHISLLPVILFSFLKRNSNIEFVSFSQIDEAAIKLFLYLAMEIFCISYAMMFGILLGLVSVNQRERLKSISNKKLSHKKRMRRLSINGR